MRTFVIILSLIPIISFSQQIKQFDSLQNNFLYNQLYNETLDALDTDSTNVTAWIYNARAAQQQYMEQQAEKAWIKVLKYNKNNYEALSNLQKIQVSTDRYAMAYATTMKMDSIKPNQLLNWWMLANTTNKIKEHQKSLSWCDTIIELYPEYERAINLKAHNLLKTKDTISALKIWRNLIKTHYKDAYIRQLALTASTHSWRDTALQAINDKIKTDSTNAYLCKMAGFLLFHKKNYIDACIMLRNANVMGDTSIFTRRFWGMAAYNSADYSSAYAQLSTIPDAEKNNSLFYMISISHARMLGNEESIELLQKTYDLFYNPSLIAGILNELAETHKSVSGRYERKGDNTSKTLHIEKAIQSIREAQKMHYDPTSNLRLAIIYDTYLNEKETAKKYYTQYCKEFPDSTSKNWQFSSNRIRLITEELHFMK